MAANKFFCSKGANKSIVSLSLQEYSEVALGTERWKEILDVENVATQGGRVPNPSYQKVCTGKLNRQGADMGTQYRSVIFYQTKEQEKIAKEVKKEQLLFFETL